MIDERIRADTVVMYRIRNEERWIRRSLERSFEVAETAVVLDDGSTDRTSREALAALDGWNIEVDRSCGTIFAKPGSTSEMMGTRLHYLHSPFRSNKFVERPESNPNEPRDRQFLWDYVLANTTARTILSLDGDEMLSRDFVRSYEKLWRLVSGASEAEPVDLVHLPVVYLWDTETQRRIDGWYGDEDAIPTARFKRLLALHRLPAAELLRYGFPRTHHGLHCGSLPAPFFDTTVPIQGLSEGAWPAPIVHFGYLDKAMREAKYARYTAMDPRNRAEGYYRHIIGLPNQLAPGPVALVEWEDQ